MQADPAIGQVAGAETATAAVAALEAARVVRDRHLAALLADAAAGDGAAFEAFYEQTFAYARTVARRLLRDPAEVEDLLADCYFEAWRSVARFDARRGSAVTWLLTLVRSRGLDALRAAAAARPAHPGFAAAADAGSAGAEHGGGSRHGAAPAATEPAADRADPAEALWRRQAGAALQAALATLSAAERWVLGLAYLREMSHAEIALCTGMPLGTVKSHALRAQHKLRALLSSGTPPAEAVVTRAAVPAAATPGVPAGAPPATPPFPGRGPLPAIP